MRIAAVTMVYKGYATLKRWCAHYGQLLGYDNLYIVSHGDDPRHREIGAQCNVIGIPRTALDRFDHHRQNALNGLAQFLRTYVDVVMQVDVDEFVFVDPHVHRDLAACFQSGENDAWFCLGFNLCAQQDDMPLDHEQCYSMQRQLCIVDSMYSKAIAGRNGILIGFHGAKDPKTRDASRMALPSGLYLAHVRHADVGEPGDADSFTEMSRKRQKTGVRADSFRERIKNFDIVEAEQELADSYEKLAAGFERNRKKRPGIWCVPKIKREVAFELPERFVGLF